MKWFKHFSDARHSESLAGFKRKNGFDGIGRYWTLLEFLSERFDGESTKFRLPRETLRELLSIRSWTKLQSFADQLTTVRGIVVHYSENVYEIDAPILSELLHRDFKKARSERTKTAPKNKTKNKIKNKNNNTLDQIKKFDLERFNKIYFHYPRKLGKSQGLTRFKAQVRSEEKWLAFESAVLNYRRYCEEKKLEARYIKHFSSFMSSWEDWIETPEEKNFDESSMTREEWVQKMKKEAEEW